MKILYFAWVRERIGKADETIELPASVVTVADLIAWLSGQGEEYAYAFEKPAIIRAAIDRVHARQATSMSPPKPLRSRVAGATSARWSASSVSAAAARARTRSRR